MQSQIEKLKTDIYQAKVCAAMRNTTLQKQWNKNISLTHMLRTLDSISAATKVGILFLAELKQSHERP